MTAIDKKYELLKTHSVEILGGEILYQIKVLRDFDNVKAGDLGGYIESEDNLSHEDDAWVSGNAEVRDDMKVIRGDIM